MTFNDNVQIDNSGLGGGGGGGGGRGPMMVGGGLGAILLAILGLFVGNNQFGGDDDQTSTGSGAQTSRSGGQTSGLTPYQQAIREKCKTGADARKYVECRIQATYTSADTYWRQTFQAANRSYTKPTINQYQGSTYSPCGTASNQTGPFYCPTDQRIYIDASFFDVLQQQYGGSTAPLAEEYVVAHEFGHHIQQELGVLKYAQQSQQGATSGSVRIELMADCLAGVWANNATKTKDRNGTTFLKPLTQNDIDSALSAAAAVGDDRIEQKTRDRVDPESFTHGTSAQRQKWFTQGYRTGTLNQCNTLKTDNLG